MTRGLGGSLLPYRVRDFHSLFLASFPGAQPDPLLSGQHFTLWEITTAIDHPDDCRTSFKILEYLTRNEREISKIPGTTCLEGTYGYVV